MIDEEALAERLQDGTLKGAALDVFAEEPLPQDSPLWGLENVIVTPHDIALVPAEEPRIVDLFIDNLRRRRAGEPLHNALDPEVLYSTAIAPEELERWSQALLEASGLGAAHAETVAVSLVHEPPRRRLARRRAPAGLLPRCARGTMNGAPRRRSSASTARSRSSTPTAARDRSLACSPPTSRSSSRAARRRRGLGPPLEPLRRRRLSTRSAPPRRAWSGSRPRTPSRSWSPTAASTTRSAPTRSRSPRRRPTAIWDTTWPPARSRSTRSSTRATRAARSPRAGASTRRAAPPPTPRKVYAAVPLGGYKGYALALLVEVLSGVLSGSGVGHGIGRIYEGEPQDVGHFHLAIDVERWPAASTPRQLLARLLGELQGGPARAGLRRGARPRRARGARAGRARARRDPAAADALDEAGGAQRGARRRRAADVVNGGH